MSRLSTLAFRSLRARNWLSKSQRSENLWESKVIQKKLKKLKRPSPWRPGSSSRKLCRWRKANNSSAARWKRLTPAPVTPVSPSTRPTDLRLSTAPRAARCNSLSRHIEHLFHWKHLHRCTVTMPNRAVPCGTFIPCVVASFSSQDHIIFTYIHIWSHTITWTRNDLDPGHLSSTYQHHILKRPIHPYTSYTNTVHTLPELQNRVPAMMVFLKAKCNFTVSSKLVAGCCKGWNLHGRLQGVVQLIEDAHLQSSGRKYVKCIKNKNQKSRVFRTLSA